MHPGVNEKSTNPTIDSLFTEDRVAKSNAILIEPQRLDASCSILNTYVRVAKNNVIFGKNEGILEFGNVRNEKSASTVKTNVWGVFRD